MESSTVPTAVSSVVHNPEWLLKSTPSNKTLPPRTVRLLGESLRTSPGGPPVRMFRFPSRLSPKDHCH
jgi:hypothetical protein